MDIHVNLFDLMFIITILSYARVADRNTVIDDVKN